MNETRRRVNVAPALNSSQNEVEYQGSVELSRFVSENDEAESFSISFWIMFFSIIFTLGLFAAGIKNRCTDNTDMNCDDFCFDGKNARVHLQKVTELGPRPAGSVSNEILAAAYLRNEISDTVTIAKQSGLHAEMDEQLSDHSFFRSHAHVTSYANLRNFILRISDPRSRSSNSTNPAFLVNCHYDSVAGSPGASDDFVSCAILLEISRIFAAGQQPLINDLIFLFNGAEESILPGSHAFITQHRWASDVVAFLNMEGAGAGGRLMVFQTGPGELSSILMHAYSQSFKQPYANVFGEILFQSGTTPSDTDFRIFRDYGLLPGMDMAYTGDGHAYHTAFDSESRISQSCLRKSGQDVLKFLSLMATEKRLQQVSKLLPVPVVNPQYGKPLNELPSVDVPFRFTIAPKVETYSPYRYIYFDVLGLFFLYVPWWLWRFISCILSVGCTFWFVHKRFKTDRNWFGLCLAVCLQFISQLSGAVFSFIVGFATHEYGSRMSWFAYRYNLIGIVVFPIIWWFSWFSTYAFRIPDGFLLEFLRITTIVRKAGWISGRKLNRSILERDFFDAGVLFLLIPLIILTIFNNMSSFILTLWVAFLMIGRISYDRLFGHLKINNILLPLFTLFPPLLLWHFYFSFIVLDFFIPVFGFAGTLVRPDVVASLLIFILMLPITLFFNVFLQCTSHKVSKTIRFCLLNACISYAILVHSSSFGFPYISSPGAKELNPFISPKYQRVAVLHTQRFFRDIPDKSDITSNDSYIFILPMDTNGVRFLKPNSYPMSLSTSILSLLHLHTEPDIDNSLSMGIPELLNLEPSDCDYSRPYCGDIPLNMYLHAFSEFYHIPAPPHSAMPQPTLNLLSRSRLELPEFGGTRNVYNFTFVVNSGPPSTVIFIRTEVPAVRLSNWSFTSEAAYPVPVPLPHPTKKVSNFRSGSHYLITHTNAGAVGNQNASWSQPFTFWLILDSLNDVHRSSAVHFDIAVAGLFTDHRLPSSVSEPLKNVLLDVPPWVTTTSACTSYHHWRFSLM